MTPHFFPHSTPPLPIPSPSLLSYTPSPSLLFLHDALNLLTTRSSPKPCVLVVRMNDNWSLSGELDGSHCGHWSSKHCIVLRGAIYPQHLWMCGHTVVSNTQYWTCPRLYSIATTCSICKVGCNGQLLPELEEIWPCSQVRVWEKTHSMCEGIIAGLSFEHFGY